MILASEFSDIFDGFSIGSNDLTQLVLGVDRDSEIISRLFDERDPAVMEMIANVIHTARAKGSIHSISLNPDSLLRTISVVEAAERKSPSQSKASA